MTEPEMSHFKASQQLLSPTKTETDKIHQLKRNKINIRRRERRQNLAARMKEIEINPQQQLPLESVEQQQQDHYDPAVMIPPKYVIATDGRRLSLFFTKKYPFSNHFPTSFIADGHTYSSSEQYYMRYKSQYFGDNETVKKIMQSSDPKEMKTYGKHIAGFDKQKWKRVSKTVMEDALYYKFTQNKALRYALFRTIDTTLVEANPMDRYWGVGLSMDDESIKNPTKWCGENILGNILTKLRDYLMKQPEYDEEMKQVYTEFDPSVV